MLRIITDKPDLMVTGCETQKDMKRLAGAHSICLDAYGTDSDEKKYDMEIQRQEKGSDPHRATMCLIRIPVAKPERQNLLRRKTDE